MMMSYAVMAIPSIPVWVPRGALCYRRVRRTMMRTVVPLLAVAWCVVFPFATAECARHRPVATTPAADSTPAHDPGTLRGTNSNGADVRMYPTLAAPLARRGPGSSHRTVE